MNVGVLRATIGIVMFISLFIYTIWSSSKVLSRGKYHKYYAFSRIFLTLGSFIAFLFGIMILMNFSTQGSNITSSNADGFTIEEYKVVLNIDDKNSIDVNEFITVNFYESGHHGIYRFIPQWLEYTGKDLKVLSRRGKISNLMSSDEQYVVDTVSGKKRIKIGNPNVTLPTGEHHYHISYTYDMGQDPYENFDEFIFHAFGDYWGTEIKNASLEIHFPSQINLENHIHFFVDKYRNNDITKYIEYSIDGNTILAKLSPDYSLNSALTVDIELPDGYFSGSSSFSFSISFLFCCICVAFAIFSIWLWSKNGKDSPVQEVVEFSAPDNLDAAEIGYLYKRDAGSKLTIALIIELASKGFITIEEENSNEDDGKKKLFEKPTKIHIYKNTESDYFKMTENEKFVYNALFSESNETILSENKTFYQVFDVVAKHVANEFDDKINDIKAYRCMAISSLGYMVCNILLGLAFCFIKDLSGGYQLFYLVAAISNIITLIFSILMKRKNDYGEQMKSRINGFKNYITNSQKEQLDALQKNNLNFYYDILPYAYVLGVSKKWAEKFENIPLPMSGNIGNFNYYDTRSIDSIGRSIYYPSSDSSSGGGGGCSSCGGGCSSCGGGGSW